MDGDKLKLRLDNAKYLAALSELSVYLDARKALLKLSKHFTSTIRSLIKSPSKLCGVEEHVARGAFSTVSK